MTTRLLAVIITALVATLPVTTPAATITVTSTNDSGPGTLRQALGSVANGDTILFGAAVTNTIALSSGALVITNILTIVGPVTNHLTISGNEASRVFTISVNTNSPDVYISNLTISHGMSTNGIGGGIYNQYAILTLSNCTLTANSATNAFGSALGGGIYNDVGGDVELFNCTLSANSASGKGGGICNNDSFGVLDLIACTLSGNSAGGTGGGLYNGGDGTAAIRNTIIAGNSAGSFGSGPDVFGNVASLGHNLIGNTDSTSGWNTSDLTGTANSPLDPALGPLADNGGPTPTMALLPGSAAIDNGASFGLTTDQRGQPRPFQNTNIVDAAGGDGSDIGAYESQTADAAGISVLNTNDSGLGSLRQAILMAPANGAITFDPSVTGTITLSATLGIGRNLTIVGPVTNKVTISGNDASRVFSIGIISNGIPVGSVYLSNLTISHGRITMFSGGAGIYNDGATLTLSNCTLTANSVSNFFSFARGGAIYNDYLGHLSLVNCTLSGNSAITTLTQSSAGGGVYNASGATITLTACTISGNSATGGGTNQGSGLAQFGISATIANTIIAGNGANGIPDVFGAVSSSGFNLIGDAELSSGWVTSDLTGIGFPPLDPGLGPLADNGGPTPTMAPLAGSAAIDQGKSFGLTTDQRGQPRPFDNPNIRNASGGDASDIGAYESQTASGVLSILNTNDSGAGSLRQAITMASSNGAVVFDSSVTGTITLSSPLVVGRSLTILGPAANKVTVSGNDFNSVFFITAGSVYLSNLTISHGRSLAQGGAGIYNQAGLTLSNCTLSVNSASGGVGNGGGIFNNSGGILALVNCTLSGNSARSGAGIYNSSGGTITLTACTISSNSASGGGVNQGGGLYAADPFSVTVRNTIIAGNSVNDGNPNDGPDVNGVVNSSGYNFIGQTDGSQGWNFNDLTGTSFSPLNPGLGPLADNGGPTPTMALSFVSAAIDQGNSFGLTTDQRGRLRPVNFFIPNSGGDASDIGAYEIQHPNQDSVGDGILDSWRAQFFGGSGTTTNSQSCALCDPDGDGRNNLQEFLSGTDPLNSGSAFRITAVATEGINLRVTWMMGSGKTNALQRTASGASGTYTTNGFADIFIVTNTVASTTNYLDVGGATNKPARYYRIRLVP